MVETAYDKLLNLLPRVHPYASAHRLRPATPTNHKMGDRVMARRKKREQDSDYDGAWKEAFRRFLCELLKVYFPAGRAAFPADAGVARRPWPRTTGRTIVLVAATGAIIFRRPWRWGSIKARCGRPSSG